MKIHKKAQLRYLLGYYMSDYLIIQLITVFSKQREQVILNFS